MIMYYMGSKQENIEHFRHASIRASQRVPTLQQIASIYTISESKNSQQPEDDLPPSYESVVISIPPPIPPQTSPDP